MLIKVCKADKVNTKLFDCIFGQQKEEAVIVFKLQKILKGTKEKQS